MTVQLSPRFLALCVAIALVAGVLALAAVGGSDDGAGVAVTAVTVKAERTRSAAALAVATVTTAPLPSTTAAAVVDALAAPPPTDAPAPTRPPTRTIRPPAAAPPPTAAPNVAPTPTAAMLVPMTTTTTTTAPSMPASVGPTFDGDAAARIVAHHNRERAGRGLAPLVRSSCLDAVASAWAARLAREGDLEHNPSLPAQSEACVAWQAVGENVGFDGTVEAVTSAWMASVIHRANILGPTYSQIGVGAARSDGVLWVVVNFAG